MPVSQSVTQPRSGLLAVILHTFSPGLGFIYIGKIITAFSIPVLMIAWVLLMGWSRVILQPWGIAVLWLGLLLIYLLLIPVVFRMARRQQTVKTIRPLKNRIPVYLAYIVWFLLLVGVVFQYRNSLLGYETFRLPSRSMMPTLIPGDYIIVDNWAYNDAAPQRGDVVVFRHPRDGRYFTKRIIALPSQQVSILKGIVYINGKAMHEPYVRSENNQLTAMKTYTETADDTDTYFVMGDNRDHSNDSRRWGRVPANKVLGKVAAIWFSFTHQFHPQRIGSID